MQGNSCLYFSKTVVHHDSKKRDMLAESLHRDRTIISELVGPGFASREVVRKPKVVNEVEKTETVPGEG